MNTDLARYTQPTVANWSARVRLVAKNTEKEEKKITPLATKHFD